MITDLPSCSFFNEALGIGEQGYVPTLTETDVLRAGQKSTGITVTRFNMGQLL
jgi:guanine nucleotide-binding protein G(i) subunit alpha